MLSYNLTTVTVDRSASVRAEFTPGFRIQTVADKGATMALPAEVIVLAKDCAGEGKERRTKVGSDACGEAEVLAFAHIIKYA